MGHEKAFYRGMVRFGSVWSDLPRIGWRRLISARGLERADSSWVWSKALGRNDLYIISARGFWIHGRRASLAVLGSQWPQLLIAHKPGGASAKVEMSVRSASAIRASVVQLAHQGNRQQSWNAR